MPVLKTDIERRREMPFSQVRMNEESLFLEIVVNGCYDCPMKYGVSQTCFLIGSVGLNRNRTRVEHNCPAPVLIGENIGIILHAYTERKDAPQNAIEQNGHFAQQRKCRNK